MVLCARAHHGWATDVDILYGHIIGAVITGNGGGKGIKIHHDQINGGNVVGLHHVLVCTSPT